MTKSCSHCLALRKLECLKKNTTIHLVNDVWEEESATVVQRFCARFCLRCFDTVFWGPYLPCQINVKFAILAGFGLNFSVVYIL